MKEAGSSVFLKDADLFASSSASIPARKVSGVFHLYDGKLSNGRYKITDKFNNVNKKPAILFVLGWINKEAICNE